MNLLLPEHKARALRSGQSGSIASRAGLPGTTARAKATHIFDRAAQDFYVEPEWCDDMLFAAEKFSGPVHDPACGIGRIVIAAIKTGHVASGSDIIERSETRDFSFDYLSDNEPMSYANIVCNPPYRAARQFIERALREARKSAFLLQYGFMFGAERSAWLKTAPLKKVWILAPRPSMPPGELVLAGLKPGGGRIDYIWAVFERGHNGPPEIGWLIREVA
ncbi:MAG: hypothetical protein WBE80_10205 [Methylocella sp.]